MNELEQYYEISSHIYSLATTLLTTYCYASLVKPFLSAQSSCRLQKSRVWLIAAAYACIMLFLHYMPYYINVILAYGIGISGAFLVMCLLDRVCISQKLFLSVTFFSLRWQAWRMVGELGLIWSPLCYRIFADRDEIFFFWLFVAECMRDALAGFLLLYGSVRLLLRIYGKKQEHMKMRELLILLIPSLSGICAYTMILFYYNAYTSALEQASLSVKLGYEMLILLYALICYATTLAIVWLFRQWKTEQEEDRQREIFSRQMQDLKSHITEAERLYKDMRALRHDMGNHLMTLKQLYAQRESEEAEAYAATLQDQMQAASFGITSGNPVTDVILADRKKEMEEKGLTPIIASHNLRELEDICDHVGLLHRGGVLLSKDLEDMKCNIQKVQCVFPSAEEEAKALNGLDILKKEQRGSLSTITVRSTKEEIMARFATVDTVFFEVLPLSLEEIFISETEVVGYDIKKLILS